MIKNSNEELIEEYLIKNQIVNLHPELTRHLVDNYLSQSDVKKSCEIFSKINQPIDDEYLSKFNLYCFKTNEMSSVTAFLSTGFAGLWAISVMVFSLRKIRLTLL